MTFHMIPYRHFALPNLFLANGYEEIQTDYGAGYEYQCEDALEHCVRCLLIRNPKPLRGWDLRFLRQGLKYSQTDFGQMVDRDAQTVARWEKSPDALPKFADIAIRMRFAAQFEPHLSIRDVVSFSDGTARPLPTRVILMLVNNKWNFQLDTTIQLSTRITHADITAELPVRFGPTLTVYEGRRFTEQRSIPMDELGAYFTGSKDTLGHFFANPTSPLQLLVKKPGTAIALPAPQGTNDGHHTWLQ